MQIDKENIPNYCKSQWEQIHFFGQTNVRKKILVNHFGE